VAKLNISPRASMRRLFFPALPSHYFTLRPISARARCGKNGYGKCTARRDHIGLFCSPVRRRLREALARGRRRATGDAVGRGGRDNGEKLRSYRRANTFRKFFPRLFRSPRNIYGPHNDRSRLARLSSSKLGLVFISRILPSPKVVVLLPFVPSAEGSFDVSTGSQDWGFGKGLFIFNPQGEFTIGLANTGMRK